MNDILKNRYGIRDNVYEFVKDIEKSVKNKLDACDEIKEYNSYKVLNAFHEVGVEERHFIPTTPNLTIHNYKCIMHNYFSSSFRPSATTSRSSKWICFMPASI